MRRNKGVWLLMFALVLMFSLTGTAFAFDDLKGDPNTEKIMELKQLGIVNGVENGRFDPAGEISYAQAVHMIVKGLGLKLKSEAEASDLFTRVADSSRYAQSFVIASQNRMSISANVDPNSPVTKEDYADLLYQAIVSQGDFYFIEIWMNIADQDDVDPEKMISIQRLLISKIDQLDQAQRYYPKQRIKRSQAAAMLYDAREFVANLSEHDKPESNEKVTVKTVKVNDDVQEVTLAREEKPNGCYGISIVRIDFVSQDKAVIYYELQDPAGDAICTQALTTPKATTYVGSQYHIQAKPITKAQS